MTFRVQTAAGNAVGLDAIEIATGTYYSGGLWGGNVSDPTEAYGAPDGKACVTGQWPPQSSYIGFVFSAAPSMFKTHVLNLGNPADPVIYARQTAPDLYSASAGGTRGPDFHLSQGGTLHGRIVNQAGEPHGERIVGAAGEQCAAVAFLVGSGEELRDLLELIPRVGRGKLAAIRLLEHNLLLRILEPVLAVGHRPAERSSHWATRACFPG